MEVTGDLTGGRFLWKARALCSKSNQVPPLGPRTPPTGRKHTELAVSTKEQNLKADSFQTTVS